ncbi:metal ABC transporter solute-binding protein, Zn/Mn family [Planococcus lenghuensis]|uniref:Adhesin n=1 Tax=Planococcus lenghuensis TaxID=2213202 RepID=A0A1Q2KX90_9BACL|nr:zinc ABC transporter substrate-binding protein [Planococcus lenghuensis]AQQ52746.1 adhesin [Planococcus lenghuensis]
MKKLIGFIALLIFLAGCSATETAEPDETQGTALDVYTTVYPLTYFAERIGEERINVQSIYPAGANEHTFEPTQQDMISLAEADVVFYVGLGLEGFIESAQETLANEDVEFAATAEAIPDLEFTSEEEHANETEEEHAEHAEHAHEEVDSHVWISPVLSQHLAESIKDKLIELDPEGAELYETNYKELVTELDALDASFQDIAAEAERKTFFVSHAAFGYLADAYGLEQVAIAGLNSQSEPSQQELAAIIDRAKELDIQHIIFEQNVSSNLTEIVQNEIGAEAVQLHNLSILTEEDIAAGEDYFSLMEQNRETLENVLN